MKTFNHLSFASQCHRLFQLKMKCFVRQGKLTFICTHFVENSLHDGDLHTASMETEQSHTAGPANTQEASAPTKQCKKQPSK